MHGGAVDRVVRALDLVHTVDEPAHPSRPKMSHQIPPAWPARHVLSQNMSMPCSPNQEPRERYQKFREKQLR